MADSSGHLSQTLGIPVIDGVGGVVKWVEALVSLGLGTSKVGELAPPISKPYTGRLADFGLENSTIAEDN